MVLDLAVGEVTFGVLFDDGNSRRRSLLDLAFAPVSQEPHLGIVLEALYLLNNHGFLLRLLLFLLFGVPLALFCFGLFALLFYFLSLSLLLLFILLLVFLNIRTLDLLLLLNNLLFFLFLNLLLALSHR